MKKTIIYTISVLLLLFFIEQVWQLPYLIKTLIKLPLFLVIPLMSMKGVSIKLDKQHIKKMIVVSLFVLSIIVITYILIRGYINIAAIRDDVENRMVISGLALVGIGLYTIFVNSFIEELFFRGYIFNQLKTKSRLLGYLGSSFAFAVYHVSIFYTWFTLPVFLLALLGLLSGGLIFAYFTDKNDSFLASWFIHVAADVAIILIGWQMFFFA